MTAAIWAFVVTYLVIMVTASAICVAAKRADNRRYTLTDQGETAGEALANAIAEHLIDGGKLGDILGGEIHRHPSGAVYVRLVTRDDAEHVGDEAEDFLKGRSA